MQALALIIVLHAAPVYSTPPLPTWNVAHLGAAPELRLAALDLVRYLRLLRCGHGPASAACAALSPLHNATLLISTFDALPPHLLATPLNGTTETLRASLPLLGTNDAHLVAAVGGITVCTGATPRAALYAVYTLLEALGARFYLTGDVLPPPKPALQLPAAPLRAAPVFAERGLQPFHDFPMGPDWWGRDFWRHTATQMAKMKMNKWGFHTYPFFSAGPEPLAWVGVEGQFDSTSGRILADSTGAYSSSWYLTQNFPRGNLPGSVSRATSDYCCGASLPFPRDCYGSPAQAAQCWPNSPPDNAAVLNDAAALLQGAFAWAGAAGISSCLGVEVPLTPPPGSNATLSQLYEGMFARAAAATPSAGCFWLWTTESVEDHGTGKGLPQSNPLWAQLTAEFKVALAARNAVAPHLAVGSNGWCLGPGDNSSYFDAVIDDPRFSLASIDGCLGWCKVDRAFGAVVKHAATVIPWMEDDLGLAGAELWVARTLAHANDAASYNASGLLGILWRTFETAPQTAALASAGWTAGLTSQDVYMDFCGANFGADTASTCASLFLALDGATEDGAFSPPAARLPRGGQFCCGGPMSPSGEEGPVRVLNTTDWEAWGASVMGAANAERAGQWVGLMQYHSAMAVACLAGQALEAAAARCVDEASAREFGFPALASMTWAWEAMMNALLAITTTPGELGMIACVVPELSGHNVRLALAAAFFFFFTPPPPPDLPTTPPPRTRG